MKQRLQALTLLDRAFSAFTYAELEAAVTALPDDHREAIDALCDRDEGFTDPAARVVEMRALAARGRLNGDLERLSTVLTDPCLAACIEALGDHADNPSEEQLLEVTPKLVTDHGLAVTRLMLATSVAGEAAASVMLTQVLRHHDELGLPAVETAPTVVRAAARADDDVKARRKAAKEKKQAEAAKRRAQQQAAAHR